MTTRLVNSILWLLFLLVPPIRELLKALSVSVFSFVSAIPLPIKFFFIVALGYGISYYLIKHFVMYELRRMTGCKAKNPDHIAPYGSALVIAFSVLLLIASITRGDLSGVFIENTWFEIVCILLINFMVIYGLSNGAGKNELPPDLEEELSVPEMAQGSGVEVSAGTIEKEHTWEFNTEPFSVSGQNNLLSIKMAFSETNYQDARKDFEDPTVVSSPATLALSTRSERIALSIASQIRGLSSSLRLKAYSEIHVVLSFCTSFISQEAPRQEGSEEDTSEMLRLKEPILTLFEECGSNSDVVLLSAAILSRLGYTTYISITEEYSHVAVAMENSEFMPDTLFRYYNGRPLYSCEVVPSEDKGNRFDCWFDSDPSKAIPASSYQLIDKPVTANGAE